MLVNVSWAEAGKRRHAQLLTSELPAHLIKTLHLVDDGLVVVEMMPAHFQPQGDRP